MMTLEEKIDQLNTWDETGVLTEEHKEKFDKIFEIFESTKDILEDIKMKKKYCEQYMKSLDSIEKDQLDTIKNTFKHFNSTYDIIEKELTQEEVENTDKNQISKQEFLKAMQMLFDSWQ